MRFECTVQAVAERMSCQRFQLVHELTPKANLAILLRDRALCTALAFAVCAAKQADATLLIKMRAASVSSSGVRLCRPNP
jgi:hypothetical protein